ncbi:MAG: hypothetical protein IKR85_01480 [Clostridia bacterium]|nr:hypothetical protein [Clostridia bacterium]
MKKLFVLLLVAALLLPCMSGLAEADKVVEWDVLMPWSETNYALLDGDITQNEVIKEYVRRYQETYGVEVKLNFNVLSTTEVYDKFPLLVAGGEIGDMIWWNCNNSTYPGAPDTLYDDGLCVDVTDMLPEYAPKFMAMLESTPDYYQAQYYTPKGRLALFGSEFDEMNPETGEVELLTMVGPVLPTYMLEESGMTKDDINTFDDLTELLRRLKDNGVEIPLHGIFDSWMMNWYYSGFGAAQSWYLPNGGDKVEWGPLTPEWREAVEQLHAWYEEGLFNRDFTNFTYALAASGALTNQIGVLGSDIRIADIYAAQNEGKTVTALHMPRTTERYNDDIVTGCMGGAGYVIKYYATFFSVNCNDLEEAIRFVDFRYDDEISLLALFGFEGVSFEYDEQGKPVYTAAFKADPSMDAKYTAEFLSGKYMTDKYRNAMKGEIYDETVFGEWSAPGMQDCFLPENLFSRTVEEQDIYNKYYLNFMYSMFEYLYKFIQEGITDDSWNEYVQTAKSLGYEELVEVQQAAYDRLIGKN